MRAFDFGLFKPIFQGKKVKTAPTVTDEDIEAFKYTFSRAGVYKYKLKHTFGRPGAINKSLNTSSRPCVYKYKLKHIFSRPVAHKYKLKHFQWTICA